MAIVKIRLDWGTPDASDGGGSYWAYYLTSDDGSVERGELYKVEPVYEDFEGAIEEVIEIAGLGIKSNQFARILGDDGSRTAVWAKPIDEQVETKMAEKQPLAFLTGSHAYGTPHAKSDVDLVIPMSEATTKQLRDALVGVDTEYGVMSIQSGRLNLILATSPDIYRVWKEGTAELIKRKPVTRDEAIECFDRLRSKYLKHSKG